MFVAAVERTQNFVELPLYGKISVCVRAPCTGTRPEATVGPLM